MTSPEPLSSFLASATGRLSVEARAAIVEQAIVLVDQIYVHLPLKRAMFAIDPVQRLRLLRRRLDAFGELAFHREMLAIFTELRDLHTSYLLPAPFRGNLAFLPFLVEPFFDAGACRYLASKVASSVDDPHFQAGVEITHMNGVPAARAAEIAAERQPGSTGAARRARGVAAMTMRPLGSLPCPDEAWVDVRYLDAQGEAREIRFSWMVMPAQDRLLDDEESDHGLPEATAGGLDLGAEVMRRARRAFFAQAPAEREEIAGPIAEQIAGGAAPLAKSTRMPDNFSFRVLDGPRGPVGYLRVWSFENTGTGASSSTVDFVEAFVAEAMRILSLLPQTGLILDVRGNPGGRIPAGERLLELLTPRPIGGAPMHLRNTPLIGELCRLSPPEIELSAWADSVDGAVETGAVYSQSHPFLPFSRRYGRIGQRYHGPVVLVVDGLCYSTTDIFVAGFQDHEVGPILGLDDNIGAGGANNFSHGALARLLSTSTPARVARLDSGASFSVAVRQVLRSGAPASRSRTWASRRISSTGRPGAICWRRTPI
ncbi:MAG: S41 family peptidase [Byssovorax sp.]